MATIESADSKTNELVLSPRDILFECPSCRKSLVVDEAAEGLIVDCPQCHINVIVPPKPVSNFGPPPASPPATKPAGEPKSASEPKPAPPAEGDDLRSRLTTIAAKLKELQTQRAEINNRLAARINEINRDLVMVARLETSHQQVLAELNQLVGQLGTHAAVGTPGAPASGRSRVNLRS